MLILNYHTRSASMHDACPRLSLRLFLTLYCVLGLKLIQVPRYDQSTVTYVSLLFKLCNMLIWLWFLGIAVILKVILLWRLCYWSRQSWWSEDGWGLSLRLKHSTHGSQNPSGETNKTQDIMLSLSYVLSTFFLDNLYSSIKQKTYQENQLQNAGF